MHRSRGMGSAVLLVVMAVSVCPAVSEDAPRRFEYFDMKMAAPVKIVLYAPDQATADRAAEAAYARFDALNAIMSDYDPTSETRRLGERSGSGETIRVSEDLWRVLSYSIALCEASNGAFDVTVSPLVRVWRRARDLNRLPSDALREEAMARVGSQWVRLDPAERTVELLKSGMRLDFGGVAKGDAIDQALLALRASGVTRALIDAGGDVGASDPPPGREGWLVALQPLEPGQPAAYVVLANGSIATSGDTYRYVEIDGVRYSHLVDPRTGLGLTDRSNVAVWAKSAMVADGLASAVSVLGPTAGLELIERTPDTAARVVRRPRDEVEVYASSRWGSLRHLDFSQAEQFLQAAEPTPVECGGN